jgi:DNA-3-methyladenine glycosylase I
VSKRRRVRAPTRPLVDLHACPTTSSPPTTASPAAGGARPRTSTGPTTTRTGAGRCTASGSSSLETFQSGLSWLTILRKRPAFVAAFHGFDPDRVAVYGDADSARLLADAGIVRNRLKVAAAITNARATVALRADGGLDAFVWSFADAARDERPSPDWRPASMAEVPSSTPASKAMAKAFRARGFAFVGPTVAYAFLQSAGVVDDHLHGCVRARG